MDLRVRRVTDKTGVHWYEVYLPYSGRRSRTYIMGFVDVDGSLVITDLFVSPSLRKKGVGRKLVRRIIKETGCKETRVNNIQEGAVGFWEAMDLDEELDARRYRRIDRLREHYLNAEGYE